MPFTIQTNERYRKINYYDTLLLTSEEFKVDQNYSSMIQQKHNETFHGEGVAWGLNVTAGTTANLLNVSAGVALIRVPLNDMGAAAPGVTLAPAWVAKEVMLTETMTLDVAPLGLANGSYFLTARPIETTAYTEPYKGDQPVHGVDTLELALVNAAPAANSGQIVLASVTVSANAVSGAPNMAIAERVYCGLHVIEATTHRLTFSSVENDPAAAPGAVLTGGINQLQVQSNLVDISGSLVVGGDLTIQGNTTTLNTQTMQVEDNIITLFRPATGAGTSPHTGANISGFEIEPTSLGAGYTTWPSLLWDDTAKLWKMSDNANTAMDIGYGNLWDRLSKKSTVDDLHSHNFLTKERRTTFNINAPFTTDLLVDTNGNVGIGTTAALRAKLEVTGDMLVNGGIIKDGANIARVLFAAGGALDLYEHTGVTAALKVATNGNVGVNWISATDPTAALEVNGDFKSTTLTTGALTATNLNADNVTAISTVHGATVTADTMSATVSVSAPAINATASISGPYLSVNGPSNFLSLAPAGLSDFETGAITIGDTVPLSPRLAIDRNSIQVRDMTGFNGGALMLNMHGGNVGIGMIPAAPLDVNGLIRTNSSVNAVSLMTGNTTYMSDMITSATGSLSMFGTGTLPVQPGLSVDSQIQSSGNISVRGVGAHILVTDGVNSGQYMNNGISYGANNANIQANFIGINQPAPAAALDVNGAVKANNVIASSSVNVGDTDYGNDVITPGVSGLVTLSGNFAVTGDLIIQGATTTVDTAQLKVNDNIITLNKPVAGGGASPYGGIDVSGIEVEPTSLAGGAAYTQWPALLWNDTDKFWEVSDDQNTGMTLAYGANWQMLSQKGIADHLHGHNFLTSDSRATFDPNIPFVPDVFVDSIGNVGIGNNTPGAKLEVSGDIMTSGTIQATGSVSAANLTAGTTTYGNAAINVDSAAKLSITGGNVGVGANALSTYQLFVNAQSSSTFSYGMLTSAEGIGATGSAHGITSNAKFGANNYAITGFSLGDQAATPHTGINYGVRGYGRYGQQNYGVYGEGEGNSSNAGSSYGGRFTGHSSQINNYGVYSEAIGNGTGTAYGGYFVASGGVNNYAGYFAGNVNVTGVLNVNGSITGADIAQPNWTPASLLGSWYNETSGVFNNVAYYKDTNGVVHLRGVVTGGTANSIFQLPANCLPLKKEVQSGMFLAGSITVVEDTIVRIEVSNSADGGIVSVNSSLGYAPGDIISLDGISFRAA